MTRSFVLSPQVRISSTYSPTKKEMEKRHEDAPQAKNETVIGALDINISRTHDRAGGITEGL